jgi:hypothetical protein
MTLHIIDQRISRINLPEEAGVSKDIPDAVAPFPFNHDAAQNDTAMPAWNI